MEAYEENECHIFDKLNNLLNLNVCEACSLEYNSNLSNHECLNYFKLNIKEIVTKLENSYKESVKFYKNKLFSLETRVNDIEERRKYLHDELIKEQKINHQLTEKLKKVLMTDDESIFMMNDPEIEEENNRCVELMKNCLNEFQQFMKRDWRLKDEKKEILYKLYYFDEISGLRSIKAEIIIKKGMKTVFDFIEDKNNKLKTDKNFEDGYVIRKINSSLMLTYQKYAGKLGFSPRDYYLLVHKQILNDNSMILCTSFLDNKYPEKKGIVRANLQFGGYFLKKLEENVTLVNFFYLDDIKTNIFIAKMNLSSVASQIIDVKKLLES